MRNPSYLTISERNIYHLRWPLPLHLLPDGKRRYIKLSLGTRDPKEALSLAKGLSYGAEQFIRREEIAW